MARGSDRFDLGRLALSSGEGHCADLEIGIDSLSLGGQSYGATAGAPVRARLDISRTVHGYALRLRYQVRLEGPCMRCLEDAHRPVAIDAREVDQAGGGDDLRSPYVDGDELDVRSWARDALALALPAQIVCTDDCRGLCAICGENLNRAGAAHGHEREPDSRWAKLSELKFE
jgi:uncharacterized protein